MGSREPADPQGPPRGPFPQRFPLGPQPDPVARALTKAALRALLFAIPLGACLAPLSGSGALAMACATWVLFPLAVASDRLSARGSLLLGAVLGCVQLTGICLQWIYLEGIFSGLAQGAAADQVYRSFAEQLRNARNVPIGYAYLGSGAILWGIALGATHAALAKREPSWRSVSENALRLLQAPSLVLLPLLALSASLVVTSVGRGAQVVEKAIYVGAGVVLLGAGFLFSATSLIAPALQLSARSLEPRLLGPDPAPPRPPPLPLDPAPHAGQPRPTRREES